jgi:serine/threonine-protein kinase
MVLAGRYRLGRRISRTEMAEVYEAVDEVLDRTVAVKLLLPELAGDSDFVTRFQREARAAASLNHPNIAAVYDSGEHDGQYFIVMEYIDGPTLADVIKEDAPLPETRAAEIGMEIAAALGAAHQQGIVHRDMKPGNVLLGGGGLVKVVDFGIARAVESQTDLTRPGTIVGSATYLSPEQAMGGNIGTPSDIYSLGVVLYCMAAGQAPFSADSPVAIAHQHVHQDPVPPSQHVPDVSPAFEGLVLRMLAKDPADRPASAEDVRQELLAVVEGATAPDSMSPDSTSVMAPTPRPTGAGTQVLTSPAAAAAAGGGGLEAERRRKAALTAVVAVILAVAVIALIAAIASQVNKDDSPPATTVPTTTIAPATTRRVVVTTRPTTATTQAPVTTEAPPQTAPTIFPPDTEPEPATTVGP